MSRTWLSQRGTAFYGLVRVALAVCALVVAGSAIGSLCALLVTAPLLVYRHLA